jgi:hypothetical protein
MNSEKMLLRLKAVYSLSTEQIALIEVKESYWNAWKRNADLRKGEMLVWLSTNLCLQELQEGFLQKLFPQYSSHARYKRKHLT